MKSLFHGAVTRIRTGDLPAGELRSMQIKKFASQIRDEVPGFAYTIEKPLHHFQCSGFFGAVTRTRTGDLILTKDALYLLSYNSISDSFDIIAREMRFVNYFS